jgi:hypothetical protein
MSRHRGAKRFRRYGLLGIISLLSAGSTFYPLSDGPPHVEPPDHYDRLSTLLDLSVSQSGKLMPLHSRIGPPSSSLGGGKMRQQKSAAALGRRAADFRPA